MLSRCQLWGQHCSIRILLTYQRYVGWHLALFPNCRSAIFHVLKILQTRHRQCGASLFPFLVDYCTMWQKMNLFVDFFLLQSCSARLMIPFSPVLECCCICLTVQVFGSICVIRISVAMSTSNNCWKKARNLPSRVDPLCIAFHCSLDPLENQCLLSLLCWVAPWFRSIQFSKSPW